MTDDAEVAAFIRNVAAHGSSVKYVHDRIGMNARLDAVQAPVLRAKLRRLDGWNAARRAAAARYGELLADVEGVRAPVVRPGNEDVWHLYVVQVDERERVMAELAAAGVGVAIHYPTPVHLTEAYAGLGYRTGSSPCRRRRPTGSCRCRCSRTWRPSSRSVSWESCGKAVRAR